IICDPTWITQFYIQIENAYNILSSGSEIFLEVRKSFSEAVEKEKVNLSDTYKSDAKKFWLKFINKIPLNINLPYRSNVSVIDFDNVLSDKSCEDVDFELTASQILKLKIYAKQKKTTIFVVLSALYGVILSKYSNQDKFLISYSVNMRPKGF